jgi:hypothetical protein
MWFFVLRRKEMAKKLLLLLCAALFIQGSILAVDYRWNRYDGTPGNWTDANNWVVVGTTAGDGNYPGQQTTARVFNAPDPADWANVTVRPLDTNSIYGYDWMDATGANPRLAITQAESWYNWTPQIINLNAGETLSLNSVRGGNQGHFTNSTFNVYGSLTVTRTFDVERSHYGATEFNQYAGSLVTMTHNDGIRIGYNAYRSIYNVYGGTLTSTKIILANGNSSYAQSVGTGLSGFGTEITANGDQASTMAAARMNLIAGNVYITVAGGLLLNTYADANKGILNIEGGTLSLPGDMTGVVDGYVLSGNLLAYNGAGTIVRNFNGTNTIVTAIPEPATMLLLGLGGLCLFRKRK